MQRLIWLACILVFHSPSLALSQSNAVQLAIPDLTKKPILNRTYQSETSITYLTLANGVRVALRPMVGKSGNRVDSAVHIQAVRVNDKGQYSGTDKINARIGGALLRYGGVANLDHQEFNRFLKEHKTYFSANGSPVSLEISLRTYPSHLEAAFQAIYAFYTKPRIDGSANSAALNELMERYRQKPDTSLESVTSDSLRFVLARKDNFLKAADLEKADLVRAVNLSREGFSNAQEFIFTIVGAYSLEEIIPIVQRYLGNLPASNVKKRPKEDDDGSFPNLRLKKNIYLPGISTAVIEWVFVTHYKQVKENQSSLDEAYTSVLGSRLKKQLDKTAYKEERVLVLIEPGEILNANRFKNRQVGVLVKLYCSPERIDSLSLLVRSVMDRLAEEPVSAVELDSFKQKMRKEDNFYQNSSFSWSLAMWGSSFVPNWPFRAISSTEQLAASVTPEALQQTARRYASTKDTVKLTFLPTATRR